MLLYLRKTVDNNLRTWSWYNETCGSMFYRTSNEPSLSVDVKLGARLKDQALKLFSFRYLLELRDGEADANHPCLIGHWKHLLFSLS